MSPRAPALLTGVISVIVALTLLTCLLGGTPVAHGAGQVAAAPVTPVNSTAKPLDIQTNRVNIHLRGSRLVVDHDERAVLLFSATNYVTNSKQLTVQLILEAPSGVSVAGASNVAAGSSQFSRVIRLAPGETSGIAIYISPHSPGAYSVTGEAVYYFGQNKSDGRGQSISLQVRQQAPPPTLVERIAMAIGGFTRWLASLLPWAVGVSVLAGGGILAHRGYQRWATRYQNPNRVLLRKAKRGRQHVLKRGYSLWTYYTIAVRKLRPRVQHAPEQISLLLFPLPYGWITIGFSAYLVAILTSPLLGATNSGELFVLLFIIGLLASVITAFLSAFHHYVLWYLVVTFGGLVLLLMGLLLDIQFIWFLDLPWELSKGLLDTVAAEILSIGR